jgi:hypothetical protein
MVHDDAIRFQCCFTPRDKKTILRCSSGCFSVEPLLITLCCQLPATKSLSCCLYFASRKFLTARGLQEQSLCFVQKLDKIYQVPGV